MAHKRRHTWPSFASTELSITAFSKRRQIILSEFLKSHLNYSLKFTDYSLTLLGKISQGWISMFDARKASSVCPFLTIPSSSVMEQLPFQLLLPFTVTWFANQLADNGPGQDSLTRDLFLQA